MELNNAIDLLTRKIQQNNDENAVWQLALDALKKDFEPQLTELETAKAKVSELTATVESVTAEKEAVVSQMNELTAQPVDVIPMETLPIDTAPVDTPVL